MIVNFRTRGISRGTRKLTRTSILIIIKKKIEINIYFDIDLSASLLTHMNVYLQRNTCDLTC